MFYFHNITKRTKIFLHQNTFSHSKNLYKCFPPGCCLLHVMTNITLSLWQIRTFWSGREGSPLRGGWRTPPLRPWSRWFWFSEFVQTRTAQTLWRCLLWCLLLFLLLLFLSPPLLASLKEPPQSGSVESCDPTEAWGPSGSGWRSSPYFWAETEKKKCCSVQKETFPPLL